MCTYCDNCPCLPIDPDCLLFLQPQIRGLTQPKIEAAINSAKINYLAQSLLGPVCTANFCEAIKKARTENPSDWQSALPEKWRIMVQSEYFKNAFAAAVYIEIIKTSTYSLTQDGLVQIMRDGTDVTKHADYQTKHIGEASKNGIINEQTKYINTNHDMLLELVVKPNINLYSECMPRICGCNTVDSCNNGITPIYPKAKRPLNFVK
jgi:hypothetical protein